MQKTRLQNHNNQKPMRATLTTKHVHPRNQLVASALVIIALALMPLCALAYIAGPYMPDGSTLPFPTCRQSAEIGHLGVEMPVVLARRARHAPVQSRVVTPQGKQDVLLSFEAGRHAVNELVTTRNNVGKHCNSRFGPDRLK